jgi:hypothetical protein
MVGKILNILTGFLLACGSICFAQAPLPATWQAEGKNFTFPFTTTEQGELTLANTFVLDSLPANPADSLFLYFGGIGWEAALEVNNIFLGVHKDPFLPWVVPLAPIWCRPGENTIKIKLTIGESKPYYPEQFLGIFRPVYLLHKRIPPRKLIPQVSQVNSATPIAAIAPYYRSKKYEFDELEAHYILSHVEKAGFKYIFFPFQPGDQMLALCGNLGLQEVEKIADSSSVSWINSYPYESHTIQYPLPFWLDENLFRTAQYGTSIRAEAPFIQKERNKHLSVLLVLMIIFPWLSFFILKLLNPALFELVRGWNQKANIWISAFSDLLSTSTGMVVALQIFRVLTAACSLTLIFYYINQTNLWEMLNWFKDWSLLSQFMYGNYSLENIFARSLLLVFFIITIEQLMGWIGNTLFKIRQFSAGVRRISLMGTFPGLWTLSIPWTFALLVEGPLQSFFRWIAVILLLIYFVRKIYISYIALESYFGFSPPIKIMYICALNILPYIIWF